MSDDKDLHVKPVHAAVQVTDALVWGHVVVDDR